jgi:membrane protein implicated in regulation of membrane protease activity
VSTAAWIWFAIALVLGVAEVATLTLAFGMVAVATTAAGIAAALDAPVAAQSAIAVVGGCALLLVVRPVVRRHLATSDDLPTGIRALIGSSAVVTVPVTGHGGQVRVRGELWAARLAVETFGSSTPALPEGAHVTIAAVDGATVAVYPTELT